MADTFTSSLRLRKPEQDANLGVWEALLNDDMVALLEQSIAGVTTVDVTAGNVTLTTNSGAADQARAMIIRCIGTAGVLRQVTAPSVSKTYIVINESDDRVLFGDTNQVAINPGQVTTVAIQPSFFPTDLEIVQDGTGITDPGTTNGTFTFNVPAANGGAGTTTAVEYLVQGDFAYINIATVNDVNFNSVNMDLVISAGVIPTTIQPAEPQYIPISFWEDTGGGWVFTPSVLRIVDTSTTTWSILQIDGTTFVNTSDRAWMYSISFMYPLTSLV